MTLDRRTIRGLAFSGLFLGLLSAAFLMASGLLKSGIFLVLASSAVAGAMVVWPELLVMSYLFVGRYGFEGRLAPGDSPVSINQMILVALVGLAFLNGRQLVQAARRPSFLVLLGFSFALTLGLGWTGGLNYGLYKVGRTWLVIVPSILIAGALIERRGSIVPLVAAVFLIGLALNAAGLLTFEESMANNNRLASLGSGPNVFSRTVGLALMIAVLNVLYLFQRRERTLKDRVSLTLSVIAFLTLLPGFALAQSRGPALGLASAAILVIVLSLWGSWRTVAASLVALAFTSWAASLVIDTLSTRSRFDISKESNYVSVDVRVDSLWATWDLIISHPVLGVGTGGWPVHVYGIDSRSYPHNFFGELAAENGLVLALGVALLFAVVVGRGLLAWMASRESLGRFLLLGSLASFVYFMVNISVSGDSPDNRLIWLSLLAVDFNTALALRSVTPARAAPRSRVAAAPEPISAGP